jgi:multifunctional cyclase/dehydratase/O-methyltransferase
MLLPLAVIGVLARLGVADIIRDTGYMSVSEIAKKLESNEEALYRLLRCAANIGVFKEAEAGRAFAMTPAAELLKVREEPELTRRHHTLQITIFTS